MTNHCDSSEPGKETIVRLETETVLQFKADICYTVLGYQSYPCVVVELEW